jgi:hypothetical protein
VAAVDRVAVEEDDIFGLSSAVLDAGLVRQLRENSGRQFRSSR